MGAKEEKERLDGYFETSYPRYVQEAFVKYVHYAYHESYEVCKKFAREEAHDLLGFQRWIELRNQLRGLGGRFSEIKTYSEPNGAAPSYHIMIEGENIILTVSSVPRPSILPRPALYRREYAFKNQLELFEPHVPESKIFGLLLHGPDPADRSKPAFLQVRFPDRDYEAYIQHHIDLFSRFDSLVRELLGTPEKKSLFPKTVKKTGEE